jgi:hypothetical protein
MPVFLRHRCQWKALTGYADARHPQRGVHLKTLVRLLLLVGIIGLAAGEKEGPMERVGKKMNDAMESAADSAKKLGDDIEEAMEE